MWFRCRSLLIYVEPYARLISETEKPHSPFQRLRQPFPRHDADHLSRRSKNFTCNILPLAFSDGAHQRIEHRPLPFLVAFSFGDVHQPTSHPATASALWSKKGREKVGLHHEGLIGLLRLAYMSRLFSLCFAFSSCVIYFSFCRILPGLAYDDLLPALCMLSSLCLSAYFFLQFIGLSAS